MPERVTTSPGNNERKAGCKAPERVMMQCGARVDDERQVRSDVGNERDKAVYSGGGVGRVVRERKPISRGRPEQVSASSGLSPSVRGLTHARRRGRRRVPDWDLSERARCGSVQLGDSEDGPAR